MNNNTEVFQQEVRVWLDTDDRIDVSHWWDGEGGGDHTDCPVEGFYFTTPASREFYIYFGLYLWPGDIKISLWQDPCGRDAKDVMSVNDGLDYYGIVWLLSSWAPEASHRILNVRSTQYGDNVVADLKQLILDDIPRFLSLAAYLSGGLDGAE